MAEDIKQEETTTESPAEETAPSAPVQETVATEEEDAVEIPAKFKKLVAEIEEMTVLELSELVKTLEKKFGVSAAAVAVAGSSANGASGVAEEESESTSDVELTDAGANKIAVIKAVKEALALGLKEAKDLVDGVPSMLKNSMPNEEATELKKKLEEAGAKVTLK